MKCSNKCWLSSCSFEYTYDVIKSSKDEVRTEKKETFKLPKEAPAISITNMNKLTHFQNTIKNNLQDKKKQLEKGKETSKEGIQKKDQISKEFKKLKNDFKKSIYKNFIDQVKQNNFVFGFQLDSKTRLDYGI